MTRVRKRRAYGWWCAAGLTAGLLVACGGRTILTGTTEGGGFYTGTGTGTGTTSASSSSGVDGECALLTGCCDSLPEAAAIQACEEVVDAGDATGCGELYAGLTSEGQCAVSSGTGSGSGQSSACASLAACCADVDDPEDESECNAILATGSPEECDAAFTAFENAGFCGFGSGSGSETEISSESLDSVCGELQGCCEGLASPEGQSCLDVAEAGNDAECSAELAAIEEAGECGLSSSETLDASDSSDDDTCAVLSSCCNALSAEEADACEDIVSAGDFEQCAAELDALESDGECDENGGSASEG